MCPRAAAFAGLTYMLVMAAEGAHAAPHPHTCQLDAALCCKPYTYECTSEGNRCKQGDADCFPWATSAAATEIGGTAPVATPVAGQPGPLPVVPGVGAQPPLPTPGGGGTSPVGAGGPLPVGPAGSSPAPGAGGTLPAGAPGAAAPLPAPGAGVPGASGPLPAPGAGGSLPAGAAATGSPAVPGSAPPGVLPSSLAAPFATATLPAGGPSSSRAAGTASGVSAPPPALGASPDSHQTTGTNLGLALGLPIALIATLALAAWLLWRRARAGYTSGPVGFAAKGMTPDLAGLGAPPVLASSPMVAERPFVPFVPPPQANPAPAAATAPNDIPAMPSYGNVGAARSVQPMAGGEHLGSAALIGGTAAGLATVGAAATTAPKDVPAMPSHGNVGAAREVQPMEGGQHLGSAAEMYGTAAGLAAAGGAAAGLAADNSSPYDSPSRSLPRSDNGTLRSLGATNLDSSSRSFNGGLAGGPSSSLDPAHSHHVEGLAAAAALGAGAAAVHHHHNESEKTLRHSASAASLDADAVVKQYSRGNSLSSLASSLGRNNGGAGASQSTPASGDHDALAALALGAGAGGVAAASAAHRAGSVSSRSSRYLGGAAGGLARRGTLHTRDEVVTVVDERTGHVLDKKTVTVTQYEGDMTDLEAHTAQIEIAGSEIAKVGETVTVEYADSHAGGSPGEEIPVDGGRATVMTTVVDGAGDVVSIKTTSSIKDPPSPGSASYRSAATPPDAAAMLSEPKVSPLALAGAALAVDEGLRPQASRSILSDAGTLDTVTRPRQGSHTSADAAGRAYDSDRTVVRSVSSNDTLAPAGQAQTHDAVSIPTSEEQVQSANDSSDMEVQAHDAQAVSSPQPPALAAAVPFAQTLSKDETASTTVSQSQPPHVASTPATAAALATGTEKFAPAPLAASVPRPPPTTLTSFPPFPRRSTPSVPEEDDYPDLSAYHPPAPTSHVCVQAYYPVRPDEMQMQVGDLVGIEREYPDGWARGQNITHGRKRAHFPLGILAPIKSGPSQRVARIGGRSWLGRGVAGAEANVVEERRRMSVIPPRDQSLPLRRRPTNASSSTLQLTSDEASGKSSLSSRVSNDVDDAEEDEMQVLETHTETSHGVDGDTTETTRTLVGAAPARGSDGRTVRERTSATNLVTKVVKTAHTRNPDGTLTKRVSVTITDTPST
ncbi:hypothetical protein HDU87_000363 [Geranomyces variabilis]|uniref:SH3 domain-containing protein n=1 Tax=Geranomyces variabilis TaxID=109894 RepID=A0AAD5TQP9_9FUNG|nr:hypothetical protein HDU87_000363 [Geranomyces variabilis]